MEEKETYAEGDVVSLKSGGPAMTVNSVNSTHVACLWFSDGRDGCKLESGSFRFVVVHKIAPREDRLR